MTNVNNDYEPTKIVTSNKITTIILRPQKPRQKKLQRRLSLVEALNNNSIYSSDTILAKSTFTDDNSNIISSKKVSNFLLLFHC